MIKNIKNSITKITRTATDIAQIGFYLALFSFPISGPAATIFFFSGEGHYEKELKRVCEDNKKKFTNCSQLDSKLQELFDVNKDRLFSSLELRSMLDIAGYSGLIDQNTSFRVYDPSSIKPVENMRGFEPWYDRSDVYRDEQDANKINIPLETAIRLTEE